jgi:hypothetical protein
VSRNAHDDLSQPYGRILIMINDCKEYFGYDYDLDKVEFSIFSKSVEVIVLFQRNQIHDSRRE